MDFAKMRPFQVIFMTVFALLALTGLIVFATQSGIGSNNSKIGTVTIWGTLAPDAITKELGAISSADKSYNKVTYVQVPADTFDANLANAIASGNGPDMVLISQEQLLGEENKLTLIPFSSIPQRTYLDTYLPEDQLYLTSTGTYGVPYLLDPLVLYYNKTLLSQAAIPTVPASWEAVTGLAPTLTHSSRTGISQSAVAFGSYANVENARAILSLLFLQTGSTITQVTSAGPRSTLQQSANGSITGVSPISAALNFYTQFADPSRTVYTWNASFVSARQAFLAGNLAFYIGFASEQPQLQAANPNLIFDMAPIPQPLTASTKIDYGEAYAFAIPKASRNQSGALLAAYALAGIKTLPIAAQGLSMAPANRSLLVPSASDIYSPVYYPEALVATGWLSPAPATTDSIFSAMITNITSGKYNASAAVNSADQALTAALAASQ